MAPARVTGHLNLIERRDGAVWFAKTRVPGRVPAQTTRRLGPAHPSGGKPCAGHLTRRQAEDALADRLGDERRKVRERAYIHRPDRATFADDAAGFLRHIENVKGRGFSTIRDHRYSIDGQLCPRCGTRRLVSIKPAELAAMRDELLAAGLAPRTVVPPHGRSRSPQTRGARARPHAQPGER